MKTSKYIFAFVYLFLSICTEAHETIVESITVSDGLTQGYVPSILQDARGFVWFATKDGLDRYDGQHFKHYKNNVRDANSLVDNKLYSLEEDALGRIWIASENKGIECFDPETEIFHHLGFAFSDESQSSLTFPKIFKTNNGKLWITTFNTLTEVIGYNQKDLTKVSYKKFVRGKNMPLFEKLTYPNISPTGEVIISMSDSILNYLDQNHQKWKEYPLIKNTNLNKEVFLFINVNKDDKLWLYADGNLQAYKNQKLIHSYTFPLKFDHKFYKNRNFIHQDKKGNIRLLFKGQLFKIAKEDLAKDKIEPQLIMHDEGCEFMYADRNNQLWFGTNGYGVRKLKINQAEFEHWIPGFSPMSIDPLDNNTFLLNSIKVINDKGEFLAKRHDGRSIQNKNASFELDDTHQYRKLIYKRKEKERIIDIPYLEEAIPFLDQRENYWIAFGDSKLGVLWSDRDSLEYVSFKSIWEDASPCYVNTIYESKNGTLWLSSNKGLIQLNVDRKTRRISFKKWTSQKEGTLNSKTVLCAHDDPTNPERYLWVGTKGGGLNKMDKQSGNCTYFTTNEGLPNDVVYGILYDDLDYLWLSTNLGLSQFNLENKHFRNFSAKEHGLQEEEFNTSSYIKLRDGRLAFGGINGISVFRPQDFLPDSSFANTVFTSLSINNKLTYFGDERNILQKPIDKTNKIVLNHDQNFISISFASLNSNNFTNNSFYYKLKGLDKDWVFSGNKKEVSYPNLRPGNYTFLLAGLNQEGNKNPNPSKLNIKIRHPWWATWLAYFVYASIFGSLIFSFFNFRLKRLAIQQELKYKEKQTQELKALDEMKTRFFSNITHEFRTPLTLLIEPARQLLKKEDKSVQQQSAVIYNNANRLLLLVNQLLDIAKSEDKMMRINKYHGDVLIVLKEIFAYFKPVAESKNQKLIWDCNLSKLEVDFDKQILEKIIYNLLSNAQKFTPQRGIIRLKIIVDDLKSWQMIVEDSGIGMKESELPKIYDRFYQTDGSSTREGEGTGIGLSLVKELVDLVEGEIKVRSEIGKGSTFTIKFPSVFEQEALQLGSNDSSSNLVKDVLAPVFVEPKTVDIISQKDANIKILIVEDNADMSSYIQQILINENFHVLEAGDGKQGFEMAKKHTPDVIISDVMMPKMDGFEMLKAIRKEVTTSHIPFIILTAKVRLESKIEGYRKGADAYLPKPFNTEELLVRLNQLLEMRKLIQMKFQNDMGNPLINEENSVNDLEISEIDLVWIKSLEETIKEKITSENFNMDVLAEAVLMSRTQFFAKVKALTGLTPAVLVKNIRLDLACQMILKEPKRSFASIAHELGKTDVKYFKKLFKDRFGKNPNEFSN